MNLTKEQRENVVFVLNWVNRMSQLYGDTVHDKEGVAYDWGQALCRECYGVEWDKFMMENNIRMPGSDEVAKAKSWEAGEIPDWVVYQDKLVDEYKQYKLKEQQL
ncbi:MAG: hypothetical protein WC375_08070 [Methanomassiliicoccales archaeon]|jgi:hypothetical protein